jgi:hypothetical protein
LASYKPKSSQERAAERRREALDNIRRQIEAGTLIVRQMTPAERKRFPPPVRPASKRWTKRFVIPRPPPE